MCSSPSFQFLADLMKAAGRAPYGDDSTDYDGCDTCHYSSYNRPVQRYHSLTAFLRLGRIVGQESCPFSCSCCCKAVDNRGVGTKLNELVEYRCHCRFHSHWLDCWRSSPFVCQCCIGHSNDGSHHLGRADDNSCPSRQLYHLVDGSSLRRNS